MEPKLEYNYHTHTYRCGHAYGEDEEYVLSAIKCGIKRLGFADHVFLNEFDHRKGDADEYISSINHLKNKYKDKVDIIVGFEAEYSKEKEEYYRSLLNKVDYLIQGQHFALINNEMVSYKNKPYEYLKDVLDGLNSGLFTYLAHPDMFLSWMPDISEDVLIDVSTKIIKEAIRLDIPLELNIHGMLREDWNNGERYPSNLFFKLCGELNARVVVGVDAHRPEQINKEDIEKVFSIIEKYNLNYIKDYKII